MPAVKLLDTFDPPENFYIKVLPTLIQENMFFDDSHLIALVFSCISSAWSL